MSEFVGRKIPLFCCLFIFAIFQIAVATAENLQTIVLCRFFGGLFGSPRWGLSGALSPIPGDQWIGGLPCAFLQEPLLL